MYPYAGSPFIISSKWYQVTRRYIHGYRHSEESILQHPNFKNPFKDWQDQRRDKLTASTFGLAVGLFPKRRVQLWSEKLGLGDPFQLNIATCWDNIKEEEALKSYELITGNRVPEPPKFVVYDDMDCKDSNWLAASPDRLLDWENGGVLEIKCPYLEEGKRKALPWRRIPLYYMPQAQGLLEITDRDWMDFYVWTLNGSRLFRVHRDEAYWKALKKALSDFWWNHVEPAKEIRDEFKITNLLDPMLRKLQPEERHESCVSIVRQSQLLVDRSKWVFRDIGCVWQ